jgi:hypothetical protein
MEVLVDVLVDVCVSGTLDISTMDLLLLNLIQISVFYAPAVRFCSIACEELSCFGITLENPIQPFYFSCGKFTSIGIPPCCHVSCGPGTNCHVAFPSGNVLECFVVSLALDTS